MPAIRLSRRLFVAGTGAVLLSLAFTGPLMAQTSATPIHVNVEKGNLAIKGYDPVAYFTTNKATRGKAEFTFVHDGATYRFASEENRKLFEAAPAKYEPQYGGFCAQAIAAGQKVEVDPTAFKIVDGKLYLNFSHPVNRDWARQAPKKIELGDAEWKKIRDVPAQNLPLKGS